jgi:Haem-binding uptake, Tiki superfamily, ChaN
MIPRDAVKEVIGAFESANLVALGERHWARQDSEFRLKLIRDPAFAERARVIVVEFATALHQPMLDAFIDGEEVPAGELSRIWRDTTQPGAFDSPVYEEFLRAVRQVNRGLAPKRRLRVVAGEPPIDWSASSNVQQIRECIEARDQFAASVIEREALEAGRKVLVVYGALHLCRKHARTIMELLERRANARWFAIIPVDGPPMTQSIGAEEASAAEPLLVRLAADPVGGLEANEIFGKDTKRVKVVDGKMVLEPAQVFDAGVKARDVADAVLYFGSEPPEFVPPPSGVAGTAYGREVDRRRAILMRFLPR